MDRGRIAVAAAATPLLYTGYLLLVADPRLPEPLGPYNASLGLWALYILPAAGLGALFAWGFRPLPVTSTLVPITMVGVPFTSVGSPGSLFAVNFPLLFLLVALLVVAGVEYGVRYPEAVRPIVTRRAAGFGLAIGVAHAVLAVVLRTVVFEFGWGGWTPLAVGLTAWMVLGAVLEAGIPAFFSVRYRLFTPMVVVVGLFTWTAVETWSYRLALEESGAAMGVAFTPFTGYLVAWFAVAALAGLVGAVEHYIFGRPAARNSR